MSCPSLYNKPCPRCMVPNNTCCLPPLWVYPSSVHSLMHAPCTCTFMAAMFTVQVQCKVGLGPLQHTVPRGSAQHLSRTAVCHPETQGARSRGDPAAVGRMSKTTRRQSGGVGSLVPLESSPKLRNGKLEQTGLPAGICRSLWGGSHLHSLMAAPGAEDCPPDLTHLDLVLLVEESAGQYCTKCLPLGRRGAPSGACAVSSGLMLSLIGSMRCSTLTVRLSAGLTPLRAQATASQDCHGRNTCAPVQSMQPLTPETRQD